MRNFIGDHWPVLAIVGFIGLSLLGIVAAVKHDARIEQAFMTECMVDHKWYECQAIWRAGEDRSNTVVVPVYTGR